MSIASGGKNWRVRRELSNEEGQLLVPYDELLAHLLFHRGIKTAGEAERFLNPNYERDLHDPFLFNNHCSRHLCHKNIQAFRVPSFSTIFLKRFTTKIFLFISHIVITKGTV